MPKKKKKGNNIRVRPVTSLECEKVVTHLGYKFKNCEGSHKQFKKENVGKVTVPQYKEISGDLFGWICRQLNITKKHFFEILEEIK